MLLLWLLLLANMVVIKEYPDGLVVRTAHAEDKESVSQIQGFDDLDYMESMYDHYIENPNFNTFLAECKGKAVAFCYAYLVDDGKVVIWGGKRVHQDFQGQGLLTKLTVVVEEYICSKHPDITTWRHSALWDEFQKKYIPKLKEAGALKKLVMRNLLCYDASLGSLRSLVADKTYQQLCDNYDTSSVVIVTDPDAIPAGLLDPATQKDIFPDDIVIVFWEPYDILASNFNYIMHTSQCNITYSGDKIAAITFLSTVMCPKSTIRFDIEIYVSSALPADKQQFYFKQHILKSYEYKWPKLSDSATTAMNFYYPKRFDIPETRSWLTENFPSFTASQRIYHTHLDPQYIACEYDRTKLK